MTANAPALRKGSAEAERVVWHELSRYRPRFTRQLAVARFILDLGCGQAKLAVQFDGSELVDVLACDEERTEFLRSRGWTVIRFWNGEVIANPDGVAEAILAKTAERLGTIHPQSRPGREGSRRKSI